MSDLIERQEAIELIKNYCENGCDIAKYNWCPSCQREQFIKLLKALPPAQPESPRTFVELVVRYPDPELCMYKEYKGKPYYSIKYIENGKTYVGYSTYNLEVLSQYLKEYFILSAQPEIIHCKDCKHHHRDNNGTYYCGRNGYGWKLNDFCSDAKRRTD